MILPYWIFLGLVAACTPGALLGFVVIADSHGLPRWARITLLLALGAAWASAWMLLFHNPHLEQAFMALSFASTAISGFTTLGAQDRKRRTSGRPITRFETHHPNQA
ncbi:hypothetical protein [Streptomyces sp. NPDC088762]|uniref:hypothetical protein n=1 Tax=Streptomyces sp. NPDC088762 TaxID=3365891 RepID=UPI0038252A14